MQIILNSRVKRNLRQKDRHVRQVHQVQAKALQCHRRPLRQRGRLPLHRQTVWQEAVRHQAAVLQEVPVTDHQAALHQEAVQHPGQQPDRRTLHSNLSRMRYNLTGNATTGQQFNISMTVDELRNGSTNLTSEVETASMVAQPDGEEEKETETPATTSTPSTTASTSASSSSTTSGSSSTTTTQNAPKTGDATNIPAMVLLMAGSAAVYIKARKRV